MATYIVLRHPVTILVTVFTKPDNLINDLLILKLLTLFPTLRGPSVKRKDLQALTLVYPEQDPLAALHLDIPLCIILDPFS